MDDIVALCKRRGFIFPTSEIYGGLANAYDYGPLGTELMRNLRNLWWNHFVHQREDMTGIDSQIILHPQTWVASGHVGSFSDPLVEDKITHVRYRADHLIEAWVQHQKKPIDLVIENMSMEEMGVFIAANGIKSPSGNEVTQPKNFNLLFESHLGVISGEKSTVYLRGETAQGIFSNYKSVIDTTRVSLPFGIAQVGKSFRNEITTGQFIFRTFEFEQAEIEYFFDPEVSDWKTLLEDWKKEMWKFVTVVLGVKPSKLRWRQHTEKERSFYSKDTYDLEYEFPFGWKELWGVAYRTDYDLKQHMQFSGKNLEYRDPKTGKTFIPHVIEPALGLNRALFMVLADSFHKEEDRNYLKLNRALTPYSVAVSPLLSNKEELVTYARRIYTDLKKSTNAYWDDRGNIGKRYKYQDEIGTPFCVVVDFQTLEDDTVTIRQRDDMKQERVSIEKITEYISG